MKRFPVSKEKVKRRATLKWNEVAECYKFEVHSELLELIITDSDEESRQLMAEPYKILPDIKPPVYVELDSTRGSKDYVTTYLFQVRKPVMEDDVMPPGVYLVKQGRYSDEIIVKPVTPSADRYIETGSGSVKALDELYEEFKVATKAGGRRSRLSAMLYGPPGNGKTAAIGYLAKKVIADGGIVMYLDGEVKLSQMDQFRKAFSSTNIMIVLEEITEWGRYSNGIDAVLRFLDGDTSWDRSLTIATTNYTEKIEQNIIDRPGRFAQLIEFKNPTDLEIATYAMGRGLTRDEAIELTALVSGLSMDYCAAITDQYQRTGKSFREILDKIKEQRRRITQTFKVKLKMGINSETDDDSVTDLMQKLRGLLPHPEENVSDAFREALKGKP